jgi:hypothetical protein
MDFENDKFVSVDEWYDYVYDALLDEGFIVDSEFLHFLIESSIDFLNEKEVISGSIEIGFEE